MLLFGADPFGRRDSADAFDRAIAFAKTVEAAGLPTAGHLRGEPAHHRRQRHHRSAPAAGTRWSRATRSRCRRPPRTAPCTPASASTARTPRPAEVRTCTCPASRSKATCGSASTPTRSTASAARCRDSTIDGLYIHHTKVGIWLDGPMHNLKITNNQIADTIADGINFHTGVTDSLVANNFVRNTGDDGLAMWSEKSRTAGTCSTTTPCRRRCWPTASRSTAAPTTPSPTTWSPIPIREGSGIQLGSRFGAEAFTGQLWITDNTTVRAGTYELNWNIGLGAIWFYALERRHQRRHRGGRRQLPGQHLQRDHAGHRLPGEGPVLDHRTCTSRTSASTAPAPRC